MKGAEEQIGQARPVRARKNAGKFTKNFPSDSMTEYSQKCTRAVLVRSRNPVFRSPSWDGPCPDGAQSNMVVSKYSNKERPEHEGNEDEDSNHCDTYPFGEIGVLGYLLLGESALRHHRHAWSLTNEEILKGIASALLSCVEPSHGHDAPLDVDADDGPATDAGQDGSPASNGNSNSSFAGPSVNHNYGHGGQVKRPNRDGEEPNEDKRKKQRTNGDPPSNHPQSGDKLWVCPFFRHDPETNRECLRIVMRRIVDVRTHIKRAHKQEPFCAVCGLPFAQLKDAERQRHTLSRECVPVSNPGDAFPGATPDMLDMIDRRASDPNARTPQEKWYVIWHILFPQWQPRPNHPWAPISEVAYAASGYIHAFLQNEMARVRQVTQHMVEGFADELYIDVSAETEELLHRLCQFVQESETDRERRRAARGQHSRPAHSRVPSAPSLVATSGSSLHTYISARTPTPISGPVSAANPWYNPQLGSPATGLTAANQISLSITNQISPTDTSSGLGGLHLSPPPDIPEALQGPPSPSLAFDPLFQDFELPPLDLDKKDWIKGIYPFPSR